MEENIQINLSKNELDIVLEALWHLELESSANCQKMHIKYLRTSEDLFRKKKNDCSCLIEKLKEFKPKKIEQDEEYGNV